MPIKEKIHLKSKGTLNVRRPINNVAVFVRVGREFGIDPRQLLEGSGIGLQELDDPFLIITTAQEIMVGRRLTQLAPASLNGLDLGQHHHLISKGKLGMAAMCCETALDALSLLFIYIDLAATYFQYDLRVDKSKGTVRLKELVNLRGFRRYVFETEIVSLHTICTMILDDAQVFSEIRIAYPAPDYAARYREIFGCPVIFDAPEHLLLFEAAILDRPLRHANPLTKKVLEEECRQLCRRLNENTSLSNRIRHEFLLADGGFPTLDQLAHRINMTERTVRRRLAVEGTSYKGILSEVRRQKALELIASGDFSMEEIARKLGYSDVVAFYHAFKTWTGTTPAACRGKTR
jgi:AraC-like DNA-binding protein